MTKSSNSFSSEDGGLPDGVHSAFLEILYFSLLYVRSHANKPKVCFALADHVHNMPHFLRSPNPNVFLYYWEVERPILLRAMGEAGEKVGVFDPSWKIIEQEYERVK